MLFGVHYYRVNVSGPDRAVKTIVAELTRAGARPPDCAEPNCLVMTSTGGIETWQRLSRRHPGVTLGLEWFQAFEDELSHLVIENGRVSVMAHRSVLPDDWGSFHSEEGEPLGEDLVRAAAESVALQRLQHDVGTMASGLDTALTMGKALGRLCRRVEPTVFDDPPREALDAVIEFAVFALWISTSDGSAGRADREFDHILRLTQSMVHAGRSEFPDQPGSACWSEWLQILIGAASNVIDAASHCWFEAETEAHALESEHYGTAGERLELEARSLLTTCLQVLALFERAS